MTRFIKKKHAETVLKNFTSKGYIRKKNFDGNLTLISNQNNKEETEKIKNIQKFEEIHAIDAETSQFIKKKIKLNV